MKKRFAIYRARSSYGSNYDHLTLRIFSENEGDTSVELTWQSDDRTEYWYGCRLNMEMGQFLDEGTRLLKDVTRILKKCTNGSDYFFAVKPTDVIEALKKTGYVRVAFHKGLGQYVPVDEWPTGAVYRAKANGYELSRVTATNEEEAKRAFLAEAAEAMRSGPSYAARDWQRWMQEGCAVELHHDACAYEAPSLEPRGKKEPEEVAVA